MANLLPRTDINYSQLISLAAILALIYSVCKIIYALFLNPLRDIPGPFLARFTSLWEVFSVFRGHSHRDYITLHEKYGPVVRVGPNRYSFNSQSSREIYRRKFEKGDYYDAFGDPHTPNMLSMRDNREHARRKQNFVKSYSMATVRNYDESMGVQMDILMKKLDEFADKSVAVSMREWVTLCTFGIITNITLGKDFKAMDSAKDTTGILHSVVAATAYSSVLGLLPTLHILIVRATALLRIEPPIIGLINTAERAAKEYQSAREQAPYSKTHTRPNAPFLEELFRLYDEQKANFTAILDCCVSNIAAGSDTTGITIAAALYHLTRRSDALKRLREEIDDAVGDDPATVSYDQVSKMQYLKAVVRETLRLHPAIGGLFVRDVGERGIELEGRFFPKGTVVGINPWALHHNEDIYRDATTFSPERWLSDKTVLPEPFSFGAGSRRCIGQNLGLVMISKIVAELVRNFDIEFAGDAADVKISCAWMVWMDYDCHIRRRNGRLAAPNAQYQ